MSTWLWVIIVIAAVLIIVGIAWSMASRRRSEQLREGFGTDDGIKIPPAISAPPEELRERQARMAKVSISTPRAERALRVPGRLARTQAAFVDDPSNAIRDADRLIQGVMRERGYPVEDFEDRAAIVSVDHPEVVERYRRAHTIAESNDTGDADTENLRQAMQDFRALFTVLIEDDGDVHA